MADTWDGRWLAAGVTAATAAVSGALIVRGLASSAAPGSIGGYLTVRNAVLTVAPLTAFALRSWPSLRVLLAVWAVVQAGDAAVGAMQGSLPRTAGPAVFAIALLVAAWRLRRRSL